MLRQATVGNGMGIAVKTTLLWLAILYLLGTSSFAASSPFDDASAAYERGDYVLAIKLFRPLAEQGIGITASSGSRSFITVKIDFLISPA